MQGQQVHLLRRLDANEPHGRSLNRFGDRLGIAIIVLVALEERFDILRRDQAHVMAKAFQHAADKVAP